MTKMVCVCVCVCARIAQNLQRIKSVADFTAHFCSVVQQKKMCREMDPRDTFTFIWKIRVNTKRENNNTV